MKTEKDLIITYYNQLAEKYDSNRFENSYGRFIHQQEERLFEIYLAAASPEACLDIGCGTGRFLQYAHYGIDPSAKMLEIAKAKYPNHTLIQSDAECLPFPDSKFDFVFCTHVFMHLSKQQVYKILEEVHRVLKPKGKFIFDFPSHRRRKILSYQKDGWHGNTSFSLREIKGIAEPKWQLKKSNGILFLPIHRFPSATRKYLSKIDNALCRSYLKEWSSYLFVSLEKL